MDVLEFLRDRREQVSGFRMEEVPDPYEMFVERLREGEPGLLEDALRELEIRGGRKEGRKKRKWEELVKGDGNGEDGPGGFSFGFGGDEEDEDIP